LDPVAVQGMETRLPRQLREIIEAQVGRLAAVEQEVLAIGSVGGVVFSVAQVVAGLGRPSDEIDTICEQLVRRGQFLVERGVERWPDGTVNGHYGFRHALYQEVLYQQVSPSRRARWHQQIGLRTETGYGERASEVAAELAVHFERGRDHARAVHFLQRAGENVLGRGAHIEAIALLSHAIETLRAWPDTLERVQQDLALHLVLGPALVAGKGHGAPEVERAYQHAAALCEQLPNHPHRCSILSGLGGYSMAHGDFAATFALGEQLLPLAQHDTQLNFEIQARRLLGTPLFWQGHLVAAREHLEKGIVLATAHAAPSRTEFTLDPGVACRSYASFTLAALGYPAQALSMIQEAVIVAQRLLDPHSLAFALECRSRVYLLRREGVAAQASAAALMTHAHEHGFSYFQRQGLFDHGWALVEQGQEEEGIAQIRQALCALQEIDIRLGHSQVLAALGEACGQVGQFEEGMQVVGEALTEVAQSGERVFEAELYRLKGELTLQKGVGGWGLGVGKDKRQKTESKNSRAVSSSSLQAPSPKPLVPMEVEDEAEGYFLKAIAIARQQEAKLLELRAVMSLVRLRQHATYHALRATLAEALNMLSEIYEWFTEGFDTKDLQEAKALLEELSDRAIGPCTH